MKKTLQIIIALGLLIFISCANQEEKNENGFEYVIKGSVSSGDSIFISLYIPSNGLDNRQTVQIINGKYEFKGYAKNYESAYIRFERDIVNPGNIWCNAHIFIEKDTVVFDFNVDTTDFGFCFKDMVYQKGSNNLYYFNTQDKFSKDPIWIYSDSIKMDSMHKYVYPGIKDNILKNYKMFFHKNQYQIVSLYYLDNIVNNMRRVFTKEHLTEKEKEKIKIFLTAIDSSLYNTQMYIHVKNSVYNLTEEKEFSFKNFTLINEYNDSANISDIISRNNITVIYFWWSKCVPCRNFIHNTSPKYHEIKEKGIEILTINTDESNKLWKQISKKDSINWENLYAGDNSEIAAYYDIQRYPTIFIIDSTFNLVSDKYEDLEKYLKK